MLATRSVLVDGALEKLTKVIHAGPIRKASYDSYEAKSVTMSLNVVEREDSQKTEFLDVVSVDQMLQLT